jgi:O-antigen/teichoic acid export membrane protein
MPESAPMLALAGIVAMLCWQGQEAMRRGLISEFRMVACIPGDALSYLGQAAAIYGLYRVHQLTMVNAFFAIGITSAIAMALQAMQIGATRVRMHQLLELGLEWWRLGKWMLLANLSTAITGISFWYMLDYTHKADESIFAIITQPLKLTNPVLTSIGGLLIPAVARAATTGSRSKVRRSALLYAGLGAVFLVPAYLFFICFPHLTLHIFFGSRYDSDLRLQRLLQLWTINWVVSYGTVVLNSWLAGLKQARYRFMAETLHMIVAIAISLPATAIWGVKGLILGGLITTCIDTAALFYFLILADRHLPPAPPAPPTSESNDAAVPAI